MLWQCSVLSSKLLPRFASLIHLVLLSYDVRLIDGTRARSLSRSKAYGERYGSEDVLPILLCHCCSRANNDDNFRWHWEDTSGSDNIILIIFFRVILLVVHHDPGAALLGTFTRALQCRNRIIQIIHVTLTITAILLVASRHNLNSLPPKRSSSLPTSAPGPTGFYPC